MIFGNTKTDQEVQKITLQNDDLTVSILTLGAIVQDVRLAGVDRSLTLGADNVGDYEGDLAHHGSLIGPIANRISNARVRIDGMMYELERNEHGRIHLHSGAQATHRQVWDIAEITNDSITLTLHLSDGMCGLPGNRQISVTYRVDGPALTMQITGTTDAKTCMNFANHSYWNLDGTDTWDGHSLRVAADQMLPGTANDYPTGEVANVTDTINDFQDAQIINHNDHIFNHNFCVADARRPLKEVLWLTGRSGVAMTLATTEPGVQLYDNRAPARPGCVPYEGLAIEAQMWPDAPNNQSFPSIMINAGDTYHQTTSWTFTKPA